MLRAAVKESKKVRSKKTRFPAAVVRSPLLRQRHIRIHRRAVTEPPARYAYAAKTRSLRRPCAPRARQKVKSLRAIAIAKCVCPPRALTFYLFTLKIVALILLNVFYSEFSAYICRKSYFLFLVSYFLWTSGENFLYILYI